MRIAYSNWFVAMAMVATVVFPDLLRSEERITADLRFGEWRTECSVGMLARKGCSIWAGPLPAWRVSGSRESISMTLFVDPTTAYASVAARPSLFAQFQVDADKTFFADCDIGVCQLSKSDANSLFGQMYNGDQLQIRVAASEGIFDRTFNLAGYKSALDTYLEEERTYELSSSDLNAESVPRGVDSNDLPTQAARQGTRDRNRDPKSHATVIAGIVAFLVAYAVLALGEASVRSEARPPMDESSH